MRSSLLTRSLCQALSFTALFGLASCDVIKADLPQAASNNVTELREAIRLPVINQPVKWEGFGSPEQKNRAAPGPIDYQYAILVAEIDGVLDVPSEPRSASTQIHIVKEAVRAWMSPEFKSMLQPWVDQTISTEQAQGCKPLTLYGPRSKEYKDALTCERNGKTLLYIVLGPPQTSAKAASAPASTPATPITPVAASAP